MYLFAQDRERDRRTSRRLLRSDEDVIAPEEFGEIFRSICYVAERDAALANDIVPGSGNCFHPLEIGSLIRADMSEAEALQIIDERQSEIGLLRKLIVPLISTFPEADKQDVVSLASSAYDCVQQFHFARGRDRKDKVMRNTLASIKKCKLSIARIIPEIKDMPYAIVGLYSDYRSVYRREKYREDREADTLDSVCRDLDLLSACIELELAKHKDGVSDLSFAGTSGKKLIVEAAYEMSLSFRGPKFVTTPHSNFAHLCGILWELAGGREEESFAGAIASFAKSSEKQRIDANEEDLRRNEKLFDEDNDNFVEAKDSAKRDADLAGNYLRILDRLGSETPSHELCLFIIRELLSSAEVTLNRLGPNLVWASRISPTEQEKIVGQHEEAFERYRSLEIELGVVRRQSANSRQTTRLEADSAQSDAPDPR